MQLHELCQHTKGSDLVDITIRNGAIFDGCGSDANVSDLVIHDGRIVSLSTPGPEAKVVIDARGKTVCPGFIDMHAHSGLRVFLAPELAPKIRQGITTEVIGVDGISPAPVSAAGLKNRQRYIAAIDGIIPEPLWRWRDFDQYLAALRAAGPSTNLLPLIPHGCVRDVVLGQADRRARPDELVYMARLVRQAFEAGAGGLSFGLNYYPGAYAGPEEIDALVALAAKYERVVMVHIRNEADGLLASVAEMVELSQKHGARVHISHLKIVGAANRGLLSPLLDLLAESEGRGAAISFDQYPYYAGSTQLAYLLPPWVHEGGAGVTIKRLRSTAVRQRIREHIEAGLPGWENLYQACGPAGIFVSSLEGRKNQPCLGRSLHCIAAERGHDALEVAFDLLIDEELRVGMIDYYGDEATLTAIMASGLYTVGSDGIFGDGHAHPRLYGAFPRVLSKYVRQERILSMAEAIRAMTSRPAGVLGLTDRGRLAAGCRADVVVFDPERIQDRGTFEEPTVFPDGVEWVIVNGRVAVRPGAAQPARAGQVLAFGRS